ncbi:MAG: ATP-binding protein [Bacteroidetes bacterium]|nr:ATP-binding protein [Bacteroidota bacterium]
MIARDLQQVIENQLFKGKVIILYGPRRVGKTTFCKQLVSTVPGSRYLNCELLENKLVIETTDSQLLKTYLGDLNLIVLDEAHQIHDIGRILKIIADEIPQVQIIATGSSSFDIGNRLAEPLTGRAREYLMLPFSIHELLNTADKISIAGNLEGMLRFGLYPEVYGKPETEAIEEINQIAGTYLYRDILQFERLRRPELLVNLLTALALQIGQEVSLNEVSRLIKEHVPTVQRYLELLEKSYIIFRLRSFSRNSRKEIAHGQKIYFYDLGIRNALIRNFNPLKLRDDVGRLWENFCVVERLKFNLNNRRLVNTYFWRTYNQKEIDYIEESGGQLTAFEFKYSPAKTAVPPKEFSENYGGSRFKTVHRENFYELLED